MTDRERVIYPERINSRMAAALGPLVRAKQNESEIHAQEEAMREALWKKAEPMILLGTRKPPTESGVVDLETRHEPLPFEYGKTVQVWLRGFALQSLESDELVPDTILIDGEIPLGDGLSPTIMLYRLGKLPQTDGSYKYMVRDENEIDAPLEEMQRADTILDGLALAYQTPTAPETA